MKSLKKKGDIFSRGKKNLFARLRLSKARWVLGGFGVLLIIVAIFSLSSSTKVIKAQDFDPNHWWGKEGCNGSEAPYQCEGQEAYPVPSVEELEPIPELPPPAEEDVPINEGLGPISQRITDINQAYQQMQTQINTCIQQKQQAYNRLAAQYQQLRQLERQRDAVDDQISRTTDERRLNTLNDQYDRYQRSIDDLNDSIYDTQGDLDEGITDCQQELSDLQYSIDEMEDRLYDSYNLLFEYELPDYAY